ncbi:MAG TPA: SDR family oxidoreductase [Bacilli bacterium]|nr:SDR family oxidoreductase [Bacilli bacterium]
MKALVTGASSGIGKDIAKYLSDKGYDLIITARDKKALEEVAKELKTNVRVLTFDLAKEENVFKLYEEVKNEDIDLLVNNAGFGLFGVFNKTDLETELDMINVNLKAPHILTKLFLQDFVKKDKGHILNVASAAGFLAGPHLNTYYATKNYTLKLTMAIYQELKEQHSNVHISALCPGPVDTKFNSVAGGAFSIKGLNSKDVAKYAIDKTLKNKLIIIPGLKTKLAIFGIRFLSYKTQLKITSKIQMAKNK